MKGNPRQSWILDSRYWIPIVCRWNLVSGFQSLVSFRILELNSPFQSPGYRIAQKKKNPGYWIPHLKNSGFLCLGRNCEENHCLESFRLKEFVFVKAKRTNAEPTYNEGPRDRQNLFAVSRFRYIRFFFIYFTITGLKKIVCYTEDIVM